MRTTETADGTVEQVWRSFPADRKAFGGAT
jgi:hypothetical protein